MLLLIGYDDIDVVGASQAVVTDREQAIRIWWQINPNNFWTLVRNDVEETGVLVGETVVVLPPDCGREEDVERGNLDPPFNLEALLYPLAVLVDHGVNDMNEWFVRVEETMSARENVALEPALVILSALESRNLS